MRRSRACIIFVIATVAAFALQFSLANPHSFVDESLWQSAVITVSHGHLLAPTDDAYGYPGTTFLLPAALAVHLGADPWTALKTAVIGLFALSCGAVAVALYALRPKSLWWIAGSILLICQPLFTEATGPSAVATALVPLICLLALYLFEHPSRSRDELLPTIITGAVCGIALATRFDISAAFCLALGILLLLRKDRRVFLIAGIAFIVFVLLNPFMWWPIQYALGMYAKLHYHYFDRYAQPFLSSVAERYSIALVSFGFGGIIALIAPRASAVSRWFLLWIACTTAVIAAILFSSHYHPLWYFFPLLILWEIFAPLLICAPFDSRFLPEGSIFGKPAVHLIALFILPALQLWLAFMPPGFM